MSTVVHSLMKATKLSPEVIKKANEWLEYDIFPTSRHEIESLLKTENELELRAILLKRIQFGTAGLRSKMSAGYGCMNNLIIAQTGQGLAAYVLNPPTKDLVIDDVKKRGIIIGYDHRMYNGYSSKTFGLLTAKIFLRLGFKVYLFSTIVPTPFVPFGVSVLKCGFGIMITASHNPMKDNGYKLYWENGCQIISPHDKNIQKSIMENLMLWNDKINYKDDLECDEVKRAMENGIVMDPLEKVVKEYYSRMKIYQFRSDEKNAKMKNPKIVYSAMHGVGSKWLQKAFEVFNLPNVIVTKEQDLPDPKFTTVAFPNPEEGKGALKLAIETAEKNQARIIIANDPDADRLAVAEKQRKTEEWLPLNGNQIAFLFADWIWKNFKKYNPNFKDYKKCVMVTSTVSSKILKRMAQVEGFRFEETLTGFKWIGNKGSDETKKGNKFLFGYEVEIGFVVGDMSYDKDGIRVAAVFAELVDEIYAQNLTLIEYLDTLYKKYGFFEMRTKYYFCDTKEKLDKIFNKIRGGEGGCKYPTKVGNYEIESVRDMTTGYDNSKKDNKTVLPIQSNAQMITFSFKDNSTATLRNSGTEPKVKWYAECDDKNPETAKKKVIALSKSLISELLQPEMNGLIPPKGWILE